MLLHQGAAAFTLWTGQPAPLETMGAALAEARAHGVRSAEGEPTGSPADEVPMAETASSGEGTPSKSGSSEAAPSEASASGTPAAGGAGAEPSSS
jgi:hypothetical protein